MTVAELIEELKKQDPNYEVEMLVDGRGNDVAFVEVCEFIKGKPTIRLNDGMDCDRAEYIPSEIFPL